MPTPAHPIRFAIFAAVSTEAQAQEDKASLPAQVATCRKVVAQFGVEACGPYLLDGFSRSGYDSLADAMTDIPPLRQAVEDAAKNKYDILIVDNFDRLGDLAYMISTRYKKLKKQIYSARQSGRVVSPAEYDPYSDDAMSIHMHVGGIIQNYRVNKIRRGYNIGIPQRVEQGLHGLQIPFGYKLGMPNTPAQPIPEQIALIIKMKDWLFEGLTLTEIVKRANATGIPTQRGKKFDVTAVRRILEHEYYAGLVAHGKTAARKRLPRSKWVIKPGKHQALWDEKTYYRILDELDRRRQGKTEKSIFAISGILRCPQCHQPMHRSGGKKGVRVYLTCRTFRAGHPMVEYKNALNLLARAVANEIHREARSPAPKAENYDKELAALEKSRARIQQGYEAELYTAAEAHKKMMAVEHQIDTIKRKLLDLEKNSTARKMILDLAKLSPKKIERWILTSDPREVNRALHVILAEAVIDYDQNIVIRFR
jgi:DNA invertase Pin-like site-specific DNA recombinase